MANPQRTWAITVTTAGTAEAGPSTSRGFYALQPHKGNTGDYVYVGNDGADDVADSNGFALSESGVAAIGLYVGEGGLSELYFDVDTDGDKIIAARLKTI